MGLACSVYAVAVDIIEIKQTVCIVLQGELCVCVCVVDLFVLVVRYWCLLVSWFCLLCSTGQGLALQLIIVRHLFVLICAWQIYARVVHVVGVIGQWGSVKTIKDHCIR